MDRALKERIIGATVLVLFVVLVVPVFLDGPENDNAVISQTVPLPGQAGDENQTIVLHRDRDHPEPVASTSKPPEAAAPTPERREPAAAAPEAAAAAQPQTAAAQTEQQPEVEQPSTEPAQETAEPEATASATGMWAVQLGSFGNQENANKLAADLRKQNYTAFLSKLSTASGDLHRVRIGPQKDRESAERVAAQLAKAGHKGQVVPHP